MRAELKRVEADAAYPLAGEAGIVRSSVWPLGGHIIDTHSDDIAAAQFAVDGEVEQCEVACVLRAAASCGSTRRGLLYAVAASERSIWTRRPNFCLRRSPRSLEQRGIFGVSPGTGL